MDARRMLPVVSDCNSGLETFSFGHEFEHEIAATGSEKLGLARAAMVGNVGFLSYSPMFGQFPA